ncbi:Dynein assembly factor with WDR repeat domains 1 [Diplonema papillatum]|nr:Dynein assembly factor with WDR repeat domains 1 [Diplonema papillatum]
MPHRSSRLLDSPSEEGFGTRLSQLSNRLGGNKGDDAPGRGSSSTLPLNALRTVKAHFQAHPDGAFPEADFIEQFAPVFVPGATPVEAKTWFSTVDHNANGAVDWDEFSNYLMQPAQCNAMPEHLVTYTSRGKVAAIGSQRSVINKMVVNPQAGELYSSATDGTVRIWNSVTLEPKGVLHYGDGSPAHSLCFVPSANRLLVGFLDRSVFSYDCGSARTNAPPHLVRAFRGQTAPNSRNTITKLVPAASGDVSSCSRVCKTPSGVAHPRPQHAVKQELDVVILDELMDNALCMAPFEGSFGTRPSDPVLIGLETGFVHVYNLCTRDFDQNLPSEANGRIRCVEKWGIHRDWVTHVMSAPSLQGLISSSLDNTIQVVDATKGKSYLTMRTSDTDGSDGVRKGVHSFDYCPTRNLLCSVGAARHATVWNPKARQRVCVLQDHRSALVAACFVAGSPQLVTLSLDKIVKVWDMRTFRCVQTITDKERRAPSDQYSALAYDETSSTIFAAAGAPIAYRDVNAQTRLETGCWKRTYEGHVLPVVGCLYNVRMQQLVTADGHTVMTWDIQTGLRLHKWSPFEDVTVSSTAQASADQGRITAICFDSNQRRLLTGSDTGAVTMWALNGRLLKTFVRRSRKGFEVSCLLHVAAAEGTAQAQAYVFAGGSGKKCFCWPDHELPSSHHRPVEETTVTALSTQPSFVHCMSFIPPTKVALGLASGAVLLYNLTNMSLLSVNRPDPLKKLDANPWSIFSSNGQRPDTQQHPSDKPEHADTHPCNEGSSAKGAGGRSRRGVTAIVKVRAGAAGPASDPPGTSVTAAAAVEGRARTAGAGDLLAGRRQQPGAAGAGGDCSRAPSILPARVRDTLGAEPGTCASQPAEAGIAGAPAPAETLLARRTAAPTANLVPSAVCSGGPSSSSNGASPSSAAFVLPCYGARDEPTPPAFLVPAGSTHTAAPAAAGNLAVLTAPAADCNVPPARVRDASAAAVDVASPLPALSAHTAAAPPAGNPGALTSPPADCFAPPARVRDAPAAAAAAAPPLPAHSAHTAAPAAARPSAGNPAVFTAPAADCFAPPARVRDAPVAAVVSASSLPAHTADFSVGNLAVLTAPAADCFAPPTTRARDAPAAAAAAAPPLPVQSAHTVAPAAAHFSAGNRTSITAPAADCFAPPTTRARDAPAAAAPPGALPAGITVAPAPAAAPAARPAAAHPPAGNLAVPAPFSPPPSASPSRRASAAAALSVLTPPRASVLIAGGHPMSPGRSPSHANSRWLHALRGAQLESGLAGAPEFTRFRAAVLLEHLAVAEALVRLGPDALAAVHGDGDAVLWVVKEGHYLEIAACFPASYSAGQPAYAACADEAEGHLYVGDADGVVSTFAVSGFGKQLQQQPQHQQHGHPAPDRNPAETPEASRAPSICASSDGAPSPRSSPRARTHGSRARLLRLGSSADEDGGGGGARQEPTRRASARWKRTVELPCGPSGRVYHNRSKIKLLRCANLRLRGVITQMQLVVGSPALVVASNDCSVSIVDRLTGRCLAKLGSSQSSPGS